MKANAKGGSQRAKFSDLEPFYGDTKSEWYAAKRGKPSPAEHELVNGLPISRCPRCGGARLKMSGHYANGTRRHDARIAKGPSHH